MIREGGITKDIMWKRVTVGVRYYLWSMDIFLKITIKFTIT